MAKRIVFASTGNVGDLTASNPARGGDTRDYSGAIVLADAKRYARPGRMAGVTTRTARNDGGEAFYLTIGAGVDLDGTTPLYVCMRNGPGTGDTHLLTWLNNKNIAGSSPTYTFDISAREANEEQEVEADIPDVMLGMIDNKRYVPAAGCVAHGLVFVLCRLFVYFQDSDPPVWKECGVAICYSQTENSISVGAQWKLWWEEPGPDYVQPGTERAAPWAIQNYFTTYRHASTKPTEIWFPFGDYIRGGGMNPATKATFYLTRAWRAEVGDTWELGNNNNDKAVRMIERVVPLSTSGFANNCHAHSAAVCLNTDGEQSDEMFYIGSVGDNLPNNSALKWRLPENQDWDSSAWTRVTFNSAGTSSPGPFEWHGAITNSALGVNVVNAIGSQHIASCPGAEQETVLCGGDTSYDWIYRADMVEPGRAYFEWCHGLSRVDGVSKEVFIITTPTTEKGGPFVAVCPLFGGTTSVSGENLQRRLLCEVLYSLDGVEWTVLHTGPVHPRAQAHILDDVIVITDDGSAHGGNGDLQRGISTLPVPTLTSSRRPLVCAPGGSIYAREATNSGATLWSDWYFKGDSAELDTFSGGTSDCPSPLAGLTFNVVEVTCDTAGASFPDDLCYFGVALNDSVVAAPATTPSSFRARTWVKVLRADGQDLGGRLQSHRPNDISNPSSPVTDVKWIVSLDRWFPVDIIATDYGAFGASGGPWGIVVKTTRSGELKWGRFATVCEGQLNDEKAPGRWPMPENTNALPMSAPDMPKTYDDEKLTISGFTCGQYWVTFVAIRIPEDAFDESAHAISSSGYYDLFTLVESSTKYVNVRAVKSELPSTQSSLQIRFVNGGTTASISVSPTAWERGSPILIRIEGGLGEGDTVGAAINGGALYSLSFESGPPDVRPTSFVTGDQNGDMNAPVEVFGVQVWESASGAPTAAEAFGDLAFLSLT